MELVRQSNGTYIRKFKPQRDVPFFREWLEALLLRHAAFWGYRKNPDTGHEERAIVPYTADHLQAVDMEGGTHGVYCLGCGIPTPHFERAKIRIGGQVQMRVVEAVDEWETSLVHVVAEQRWLRRTMHKIGFGCPDCAQRYLIESARVEDENQQRRNHVELLRIIYTNKRDAKSLSELREAREAVPFLDIMSGSVATVQLNEAQLARL